jgi:hypothetical protein
MKAAGLSRQVQSSSKSEFRLWSRFRDLIPGPPVQKSRRFRPPRPISGVFSSFRKPNGRFPASLSHQYGSDYYLNYYMTLQLIDTP